MNERLRIGLLLAVALLVYGNALRNDFTMDDGFYILHSEQVTHPSVRELFTAHQYTNVFRPLTFATFAVNWKINGARPFGYHLINLLLHAAVTLLLYLLLLEILGRSSQAKATSLVAACLFAVHPIHTEAVTSIVGRSELLAAGFLIAAWLLHLRDREIPALICFLLALLSKESAVVFLGLVLVGDYALGKWKPISRYVRIGGMTLLYLAALWRLQGGHFGAAEISMLDNPLANLPSRWRILNAIRVAWRYVALQFYPATLSCDYSFHQIGVYVDWRHTLPAALAAVAVAGGWIWSVRKRQPAFVLAGGIYFAAFAVTSNILMPTGTIMAERLTYLPSAGFCLLVAMGLIWLKQRQRLVALTIFTLIIAVLGVRTVVRNLDWKNDFYLYSAGVRAAPGSAKMHADLGRELLNYGNTDLARTELQTALRIHPDYPDALASFGLLEASLKHYEVAGGLIEKALRMSGRNNPNYDFMDVSMAVMLIETGRTDDAIEVLNSEIAESPKYSRAWSNRAVAHFKKGDRASARADSEAALRLDPGNAEAQNLMRVLGTASPVVSPQKEPAQARAQEDF